jgi:PAS domain S-box-containing protein
VTVSETGHPVILVVEDNDATRKLIRAAFSNQPVEIVEAKTGAEAIELMNQRAPDLVLQDLLLPDMDGFDLVEKLRASPRGTSTPIVACSGFFSRGDEARASTSSFTDIIVKPIEPARLIEAVLKHLPQRSPVEPAQGRRLVLADDDPIQLKLVRTHLAGLGFELIEAPDGAAALEIARQVRPEAIVSDVLMPHLDGFGLCSAVRADPVLSRTPVVLVSANYVEEADRRLAEEVGANALVVRTPSCQELIAALKASLEAPAPPPRALAPEPLDQEHIHRVIRQLERQAAMNVGLAQRCSLQAAELSVLSGISDALASHRDIDSALEEALMGCLDAGGISLGALYSFDDSGERLELKSVVGRSAPEGLGDFFGRRQVLQQIVSRRTMVSLPSPSDDLPKDFSEEILAATEARSALVLPVCSLQEELGCLIITSSDRDLVAEDWPAFARTVANQIAQAIALARAFARIAASERRFRSLVESINDLVVLIDRDERFIEAHGRLGGNEGLTPNALIGRKLEEIVGPKAAAEHRAALARGLEGRSAVYEWTMDGPGGQRHFETSLARMSDPSGRQQEVVGVIREITEQKRLQAQLMVSDRLISIGALAAGVAHEINNPLAAVMANIELVTRQIAQLDTNPVLEETRAMLSDAREGAVRVQRIVGDLKLFSRAEDVQMAPVDVKDVLESTLRMAWNEVRHRAKLVRRYQDVPTVMGNSSRLGQVFLNLLVNAAQAIPEGRADDHEIRVGTSTDDRGRAVIEIEDTGVGMKPETLRQIFDPFFTTKPAGVGVGLGLSICQRLVNAMGGEISAESSFGKGSLFRVVLPPSEQVVRPTDPAPPIHEGPATRRGRILVVDDERMIGTVVRRMLGKEHEVVVTTSAEEALGHIGSGERFDLILCDLMMPVLTGMDFYHRLSEMDSAQAARVVFLTGGAFTPKARAFLDEVENARLEKPFDVYRLRTLVHDRISQGGER